MSESLKAALNLIAESAATESPRLDLGGYTLQTLPEEIGRLTWLTHLSLRNNELTTLPSVICELVQLQQLSLADNRLTSLPEEIGALTSLTHLNLKNNQLSDLPAGLLHLDQLESLQLAGNRLPIPVEIISRWNRPEEILAYYRVHCIVEPAPPPPVLDALVARYFDEEALDRLWAELAVPLEYKPAGSHEALAGRLVEYHVTHGLEGEIRELFQILVPHINWQLATYELPPGQNIDTS